MSKLFWVDLEMSGLEVESNVIIEAAVVITDKDLNEIESYHSVVRQPQSYIDKMDEWNKKTHGESGLIAQIPNGKNPADVEKDFVELAKKYFPDFPKEKVVIAGNSVGHDKNFLNYYFKDFSKMLHYRTLDVTSWKIIFQNKYKKKYEKKGTHRAVDDIRESIAELKYYLSFVKQ